MLEPQTQSGLAGNAPAFFPQAPEQAFQDELVSHIPHLRRYARSLARDAEAADDLVHETLLRAMEKHHLWERGTNLKAWTYRILRNTFINLQRRGKLRDANVSPDDYDRYLRSEGNQIDHLVLKALEKALHRLPDHQREAIALIGIEGLSYEEASVIMDCPLGTVRSRLARAREALKAQLQDAEP